MAGSVHPSPQTRLVDRIELVVSYATGKSVVDLGFVDESRMLSKQALGTWLHAEVARRAASIVGIDNNAEGVELARRLGYDAHRADCQDPEALRALDVAPVDVVVAGELIEHLDQPGRFLDAVKVLAKPTGTLLITTPNACSMTNFLSSVLNHELVNADHVAWFSWHTLQTLLGRHGWVVREVAYYGFPKVSVPESAGATDRRRSRLFNLYQRVSKPLFRLRPPLADGLIVAATRAYGTEMPLNR